jgi:hypothetical protein
MPLHFDSFAVVLGPSSWPGILSPAAYTRLFSPMSFDPSNHSWLTDLSPFLPSVVRAEPAQPPAGHTHHAVLATFSVLEFFSNFLTCKSSFD